MKVRYSKGGVHRYLFGLDRRHVYEESWTAKYSTCFLYLTSTRIVSILFGTPAGLLSVATNGNPEFTTNNTLNKILYYYVSIVLVLGDV